MIDHRKDYDENDEACARHRRVVELMRMRGKINRQETCVQFGMVIAAILFAFALIMSVQVRKRPLRPSAKVAHAMLSKTTMANFTSPPATISFT
jgi:hypothetical protein